MKKIAIACFICICFIACKKESGTDIPLTVKDSFYIKFKDNDTAYLMKKSISCLAIRSGSKLKTLYIAGFTPGVGYDDSVKHVIIEIGALVDTIIKSGLYKETSGPTIVTMGWTIGLTTYRSDPLIGVPVPTEVNITELTDSVVVGTFKGDTFFKNRPANSPYIYARSIKEGAFRVKVTN